MLHYESYAWMNNFDFWGGRKEKSRGKERRNTNKKQLKREQYSKSCSRITAIKNQRKNNFSYEYLERIELNSYTS